MHVEVTGYRGPVNKETLVFSCSFFVFSYFPTEPYICWHSMLFGANVCQRSCECFKLPALHCWSFCRFSFFTPLQACVQFFGVCSAFIRCLLTFFVLTAFEVVFIFNALGLRVSLFDLPAAYKVFFFFFFLKQERRKKKKHRAELIYPWGDHMMTLYCSKANGYFFVRNK